MDQLFPTFTGFARRVIRHPWSRAWILAEVVVIAGWLFGLATWGAPREGYALTTALFWIGVTVAIGFPLLLAGGLLRRSTAKTVHVLGVVVSVAGVVWVTYVVQFSHFGGFCIDPPDRCVIPWSHRIGALLVGLVCIAFGRAAGPDARNSIGDHVTALGG